MRVAIGEKMQNNEWCVREKEKKVEMMQFAKDAEEDMAYEIGNVFVVI